MGRRVLLIVVGLVVALLLDYAGMPRRWAMVIGLLPFAILEGKGLLSPYESSAHDVLHGSDDSSPGGTPKRE